METESALLFLFDGGLLYVVYYAAVFFVISVESECWSRSAVAEKDFLQPLFIYGLNKIV